MSNAGFSRPASNIDFLVSKARCQVNWRHAGMDHTYEKPL